MSSELIGNNVSGIDRNLKKAMESTWFPFKDNLKKWGTIWRQELCSKEVPNM